MIAHGAALADGVLDNSGHLVDALLHALLKVAQRRPARQRTAEDETRVARQRTLFNMLPSSNSTDRLKEAMLQRAYDLLWDGDTDGCDALIEFLPSDDVTKMLDA